MSPYKKLYKILKSKFPKGKNIALSDVESILFLESPFGSGVDSISVLEDMITLKLIRKENEVYNLI